MHPIVALTHGTRYRYDRPVSLGPQTVRLRPSPHGRTPILRYDLRVSPEPESLHWLTDPMGNHLALVRPAGRIEAFELVVTLAAELAPYNPFDFLLDPEAAEWPFAYPALLDAQLAPFRASGPSDPAVSALTAALGTGPRSTVELLVAANALVSGRVAYLMRPEPGVQSPAETLALGQGSCRDSGWLLVHLLRALGFAARFCSGYLVQLADDDHPDRADLHAWAEVWLPGGGWVGLDATSSLLAAEGHIPLASAPDPVSVAPVSGRLEPVGTAFSFSLTGARLASREAA